MDSSSQNHSRRRGWLTLGICAGLIVCFVVLAALANGTKCATYDEPLHFVSAWTALHDRDFRCDPEDPPLWKYVVAAGSRSGDMKVDLKGENATAMLDNPYAESKFAAETLYIGNDADALLRPAHLRMLLIAVALAALMAAWAWRLGGMIAAITATALFCFDPNFMAHAPLIKNDVAMSLPTLWLAYSVWRLGEKITWFWLFAVAAAMGIALTTKFTGVLMIAVLAIMLIGRAMLDEPWPAFAGVLRLRWQRLLAAAGVFFFAIAFAWVMIWACYGFRFGPMASSAEQIKMSGVVGVANAEEAIEEHHVTALPPEKVWRAMAAEHRPSWKVNSLLFVERHHLVPQSYLAGFLFTYANSLVRPAFLMDRISFSGYWYYFPLAMLFKTPVATLAALALSAYILCFRLCKRTGHGSEAHAWLWPAMCLVIAPGFYLLSAMSSHMNLGIRHVLLLYPFAYVGAGVAAKIAWEHRPRAATIVAGIIVAALIIENIAAFPDYIPFFNVVAEESAGGINLLSDSNLDWGQDLPLLAAWQREHPNRPILLGYFGQALPKYYGIHYINLFGSDAGGDIKTDSVPPNAVLALSATNLQGTYLNASNYQVYARWSKQKPFAVLGKTIYLFDNDRRQ